MNCKVESDFLSDATSFSHEWLKLVFAIRGKLKFFSAGILLFHGKLGL